MRNYLFLLVVVAVIGAGVVAGVVLGGGGGRAPAEAPPPPQPEAPPPAAPPEPKGPANGRELFSAEGASCHTLRAAGASGLFGPNLDRVRPSTDRVLAAIRTGPDTMPEGIYQGS